MEGEVQRDRSDHEVVRSCEARAFGRWAAGKVRKLRPQREELGKMVT